MTIKTKTGKEFECDLVIPNQNPQRLYLHIVGSPVKEVGKTFTDEETELPIECYEQYTAFDSMNMTPDGGINICLK